MHEGEFDLILDLKNSSNRRSPEIEAIYVTTSKAWALRHGAKECGSIDDETGKLKKHLITPSIRRLAPGAFSQEKIQFSKRFWSKFSGDEEKDSYTSKGSIKVEVSTSEGTLSLEQFLEVKFDEFPF